MKAARDDYVVTPIQAAKLSETDLNGQAGGRPYVSCEVLGCVVEAIDNPLYSERV